MRAAIHTRYGLGEVVQIAEIELRSPNQIYLATGHARAKLVIVPE